MQHLNIIEELTNVGLVKKGFPITCKKELLKFFGVVLLIPRLPDMPRRDLWRAQSRTTYGIAADLGRTGMSRKRFEALLSCIQ